MKKVLFVLGLAMCTTLAMAQTGKVAQKLGKVEPATQLKTVEATNPVDYKASIFTKDDDVVLTTFDFANLSNVTIGTVTDGQILDGAAVTIDDIHARVEPSFNWSRIPDTAYLFGTDFATDFNGFQTYNNPNTVAAYMGVQNGIDVDNGFMFLSLCEDDLAQYYTTIINTYFELAPVAIPTSAYVIDITWRQYYRKYYDLCYIDYKIGNNWISSEVNVSGVDVTVGGTASAYNVLTLPASAADNGNLAIRFRLKAGVRNVPYGYGWAVDNVKVVAVNTPARWSFNSEGLLNGFYGILPEGFQIPVSYCLFSRNTSVDNLTGNKLAINHSYNDGPWSEAFFVNQDAMASGDPAHNYLMEIDESGFMYAGGGFGDYRGYHAFPEYYTMYGASDAEVAAAGYQRRSLPTTGVGKHSFNIVASNTNGLVDTIDAYSYMVSDEMEANADFGRTLAGYRWANDNGIVPAGREFGYGFTSGANYGYVTSESEHQYEPGYQAMTRYNTPSVIPTTNGEPWVIRGIEYVTSTKITSQNIAGSSIIPLIYYYRVTNTTPGEEDGGWYNWLSNTGLVGDPESVTGNSAPATLEYEYTTLENENYYCYNVLFPDQPALQPNMSFLVGYQNNGGGDFAVATTSVSTMTSDSTAEYYSAYPDIADFYRQFTPTDKVYDAYAVDPVQGSRNDPENNSVSGWNITRYPMIRLIVGPKMQIETFEQFLDCGENEGDYWIYYGGEACGLRDSAPVGSGRTYFFIPGEEGEMEIMDDDEQYYLVDTNSDYSFNKEITAIRIDGQTIDLNDTNIVEKIDYTAYWPGHTPIDQDAWEPALVRYYYAVTVRNINADHTYSADVRTVSTGIRNVEDNINMHLAPNPATSQVRVNVAGFSGKANCSIIDMSGRVVYSTDITAGENTISLNGISAGAYFVRVTNNVFSKVEKLIVR